MVIFFEFTMWRWGFLGDFCDSRLIFIICHLKGRKTGMWVVLNEMERSPAQGGDHISIDKSRVVVFAQYIYDNLGQLKNPRIDSELTRSSPMFKWYVALWQKIQNMQKEWYRESGPRCVCVCVSNIAKMCKAWRFKSSYHDTDPWDRTVHVDSFGEDVLWHIIPISKYQGTSFWGAEQKKRVGDKIFDDWSVQQCDLTEPYSQRQEYRGYKLCSYQMIPAHGEAGIFAMSFFQGLVTKKSPDLESQNGQGAVVLLVGGLVASFYFPMYWESHHPNWLYYTIFFRGVAQPPTSLHRLSDIFPETTGDNPYIGHWKNLCRRKNAPDLVTSVLSQGIQLQHCRLEDFKLMGRSWKMGWKMGQELYHLMMELNDQLKDGVGQIRFFFLAIFESEKSDSFWTSLGVANGCYTTFHLGFDWHVAFFSQELAPKQCYGHLGHLADNAMMW